MHRLFFILLLLFSTTTLSDVRYNPYTGYWEGNVCANYFGWSYVPYQPVGSFCQVLLPNGMISQGQVINR